MATSTNLDFLTQMEEEACSPQDLSFPSVISETQEVTTTAATPSHHSEPQIEQADQSEVNANRAASEHSPAPDKNLIRNFYTSVYELCDNGFRLAVTYQAVGKAAASYHRRYLEQNSSDPRRSEQSTPEHIIMVIGQDPDLDQHAAAVGPDNVREFQHEKKSPSQDEAGGVLLDKAGTSSRPAKRTDGGALVKQEAPCAVSEKKTETDMDLPKLADLKKRSINDETTFRKAFQACNFQAIKVGASAIDLLDLATAAIDVNRQKKARTTTDEETWQLMFNIIANLFVFELKPLNETFRAISESSASDTDQPSATDQMSGIAEDEEELESLTKSMCSWMAEDDSSPLSNVYSYYDKLRMVERYDKMTNPENEKSTKDLLKRKKHPLEKRQRVSTAISRYICERYICQQSREEDIKTAMGQLSIKISNFRPVCGLVKAFGQGVLVLLGANPQNFLNMVKGRSKYPKHKKLGDVAKSLSKADGSKYHGQLRTLFVDLRDKVLRPALRIRKHKSTDGWLIDYPGKIALQRTQVGERISFILGRIKKTNACSDDVPAHAGERSSKRRMSSSGMEEAAEGAQSSNKRTKVGCEDRELGKEGSESGIVPEEDLYLS